MKAILQDLLHVHPPKIAQALPLLEKVYVQDLHCEIGVVISLVICRLGLIGDLGQTEDSLKTLLHLNRLEVASVLNVGDLSYADSYQPRWDSWNRLLEVNSLCSLTKTPQT